MDYKDIFRQAYVLTLRNYPLWLFGLVLLGGFNLSLINFGALFDSTGFNVWTLVSSYSTNLLSSDVLFVVSGIVASFLVIHLLKVAFLVAVHGLVHDVKKNQCRLCGHVAAKSAPYFIWWKRIIMASLITIALSTGVGALVNLMLNQVGTSGALPLILNFIFLVVVVCSLGTWNTFVSYFVVFHDMGFNAAASASFSLLTLRYREVIEFVVLLSIAYTVAVIVGQAFINVWQHGGYGGMLQDFRIVFLAAFVVWSAVNNLFFNIAFLLFFDKIVRSVPVPDEAKPLAQIP